MPGITESFDNFAFCPTGCQLGRTTVKPEITEPFDDFTFCPLVGELLSLLRFGPIPGAHRSSRLHRIHLHLYFFYPPLFCGTQASLFISE